MLTALEKYEVVVEEDSEKIANVFGKQVEAVIGYKPFVGIEAGLITTAAMFQEAYKGMSDKHSREMALFYSQRLYQFIMDRKFPEDD